MSSRPATYRVSAVRRKGMWTISYAGQRTTVPPPRGRTLEEAQENARKAIADQFRVAVEDVQVSVVSRDGGGLVEQGCAAVFVVLIFPFILDVVFTGGAFTAEFIGATLAWALGTPYGF